MKDSTCTGSNAGEYLVVSKLLSELLSRSLLFRFKLWDFAKLHSTTRHVFPGKRIACWLSLMIRCDFSVEKWRNPGFMCCMFYGHLLFLVTSMKNVQGCGTCPWDTSEFRWLHGLWPPLTLNHFWLFELSKSYWILFMECSLCLDQTFAHSCICKAQNP